MNVLLYSGGLDSFIAYHLLTANVNPWQCLYVGLGTRYAQKELDQLYSIGIGFHHVALPLGHLEQEDAFVPQRNLLLLTLAQAEFNADRVALAAVRGEFSRDKHPAFFRQASGLLSYTAGKPVQCFSPLAKMTKTQAVAAYLKAGGSAEALLQTVSCYHAESLACGQCMSCYRRWVALENNGLEQEWDYPPWHWMVARRKQPPLAALRKLPIAQWPAFVDNQVEALSAHVRRKFSPN